MSPSFFLVQWMPGPCTEPGTSKEFSIIGIEDIKEDYRYALEKGRITMATYRFSTGPNTGTMHRLCKILYTSGDKSALEVDLMAVMNSGEDGTAVYTIEDEKLNHLTLRKQTATRPPPWEVEKEMLTLLEDNHKVRRENEELKAKLAKAVDVGDLKNILETTLLNIQQKQIVQPPLERQPSSNQASKPIIESLPQGMDANTQPQLPSPNMNNRTLNQGIPVSPPSMQRNPTTRQTPPMNRQLPASSHVVTAPTQQPSTLPETELDNPYIVKVQSLADQAPLQRANNRASSQPKPAPHPIGIRSVGLHDKQGSATPSKQEVRRFIHPAQRKSQKMVPRQRQIKTPQWQANYVSDGITERLRIGRTGQNPSSSSANSMAEVPAMSTQLQQQMQMQSNIFLIDDQDGDKLEELVQGSGIWLPHKHIKMSQRVKGLSQYTRKLVMLLFNMKELSTSSVTGFKATGKGSENAIARPALDPKRVQAIITAVKKRFPQASPFKVKQVMSQKLMDIRKTVRNKMIKNATWKQNRLHHGIH